MNRAVGYYADPNGAALLARHNLFQVLDAEETFEAHPEIFPMNEEGEYVLLCTASISNSHRKTAELLAEKLRDAKTFAGGIRSSGQGDGFEPSFAPGDRKLACEHKSEAAPYLYAFNKALDILTEDEPDFELITYAFFGTMEAPEGMEVHPNLWINLVTSDLGPNAAGDQMGPILNNPANRDYARAIREWTDPSDKVAIWH